MHEHDEPRGSNGSNPPAPMAWRGINYDVGTRYGSGPGAGSSSADYAVGARLPADMRVIAETLCCNAVQVYGTDLSLLGEAAEVARAQGLEVWIQPRLVDASADETFEHIASAARIAESVRTRSGGVVLSVGVEASVFVPGIIPGHDVASRMSAIFDPGRDDVQLARRLDRHLGQAEAVARTHFAGPVTYGAGMWEPVDWRRRYDIVGLDLYVRPIDVRTVETELRQRFVAGKPLVVTEYGCVTHAGGLDAYGADIVDWARHPPGLSEPVVRSEDAQSEGIERQWRAMVDAGVAGAFCFTLFEPMYQQAADGDDLDAASFGIVRPSRQRAGHPPLGWEPKTAFHTLAELHRSIGPGGASASR